MTRAVFPAPRPHVGLLPRVRYVILYILYVGLLPRVHCTYKVRLISGAQVLKEATRLAGRKLTSSQIRLDYIDAKGREHHIQSYYLPLATCYSLLSTRLTTLCLRLTTYYYHLLLLPHQQMVPWRRTVVPWRAKSGASGGRQTVLGESHGGDVAKGHGGGARGDTQRRKM